MIGYWHFMKIWRKSTNISGLSDLKQYNKTKTYSFSQYYLNSILNSSYYVCSFFLFPFFDVNIFQLNIFRYFPKIHSVPKQRIWIKVCNPKSQEKKLWKKHPPPHKMFKQWLTMINDHLWKATTTYNLGLRIITSIS